ncbi:MAG TPA: PaaI family thioesterase [Azospirillaceae bacterium]|nr:PaaI family thioesterase [Azospirillaceae bacterium]
MSDAAAKKFTPRNPDWESLVRDILDRQPIVKTLGIEIEELSPGRCTLAMDFRPELAQQHGFFQAGVVSILADNAGGMAAASLMPAGADILAVEFKINFIAPAKGSRMRARAEVVKAGRTLTISQITVSMQDGDHEVDCALMQQTCMAVGG